MTTSSPSIQEVNLASIVVQSALYGIFFVLSILALALLYLRQERKQQFRPARGIWTNPLFIASVALLLIVTAVRRGLLIVVHTTAHRLKDVLRAALDYCNNPCIRSLPLL